MEPANLNPPPNDDAHLAALLRQNHTDLPDDGFTARVLAALPPRAPRSAPIFEQPAARAIVFSLAALAGLAFAFAQGLTWETITAIIPTLQQAAASTSVSLADPTPSLAFLIAALSILYAMKDRLLRQI